MLKIENLKKNFRSKGKCFSLTIILRRSKHRKIQKSFSLKPFYVERNGALNMNSTNDAIVRIRHRFIS
jgi:hypothetical protein